jgi:putative Mn2+ efflux pump MntP
VFITGSALALGILHGLGADHLMAIATLAVNTDTSDPVERNRGPLRVAVRFALGHALLLLVGAGTVLVLGWQIPELVERTGEMVGGVLLVVLGAFTLWVVAADRLYGHSHGAPSWLGWHVHFGRRDRHPPAQAHSQGAGLLGAVFAVSGLRALTLLAPELDGSASASVLTLVYLVAVFSVGILLSMSLFGIVLSRVLGLPWVVRTIGRGAALLTAVASIGLGVFWIAGAAG